MINRKLQKLYETAGVNIIKWLFPRETSILTSMITSVAAVIKQNISFTHLLR